MGDARLPTLESHHLAFEHGARTALLAAHVGAATLVRSGSLRSTRSAAGSQLLMALLPVLIQDPCHPVFGSSRFDYRRTRTFCKHERHVNYEDQRAAQTRMNASRKESSVGRLEQRLSSPCRFEQA